MDHLDSSLACMPDLGRPNIITFYASSLRGTEIRARERGSDLKAGVEEQELACAMGAGWSKLRRRAPHRGMPCLSFSFRVTRCAASRSARSGNKASPLNPGPHDWGTSHPG